MSLTRKASSAARKPTKRPPQDPAAALAEREAELAEARRQQTATSDILKVIASSPGELQPVLDKIVEAACRLCNAYDAVVLLREGDQLRVAAHYGPIPITFASQAISRGLLAGRAVIERRAIHIDDIAKHADEYPVAAALASQRTAAGSGEMLWRANLVMPLIREGEAVGVIGLRRAEPVPFSEGQIELLKTFSDQAVIAIENVRLFDEVQARTSDLTESLEQQTASADILRVISQSPTDARPVFERIVVTAARVLKCDLAAALLRDGRHLLACRHRQCAGPSDGFCPSLAGSYRSERQFSFARDSRQDYAALARLVSDRRAPARAGDPKPRRRQFGPLPAAAARGRMHRPPRPIGNSAEQLRPEGNRCRPSPSAIRR